MAERCVICTLKFEHWDEELRFMYKNSQGHLTVFCIVFVWLRGRPSPVRIMTQVPWFMYQNRLGPSGGIYYPSFAPCFVVLYLNWISPARSTAVRKTAATARLPAPYSRYQRGLDPRRALLLLLQRPIRERLPVGVYTTIVVSVLRVGHISKYVWGTRVNVIKK